MSMRQRLSAIFLSVIVTTLLSAAGLAQEPSGPQGKPRPARPAQKPEAGPLPTTDAPVEAPVFAEQMRRTLNNLSAEIDSLNAEIKLLRRATERNSLAIELLLSEDRLAKAEEKLDQATQRKVELDARDADL